MRWKALAVAALAMVLTGLGAQAQGPPVVAYPAPWSQTGSAVSLSVSNSSSRVQLGWVGTVTVPPPTAFVCNTGANTAYVALGDATIAATTSSFPVLAGYCNPLAVNGASNIAGITASSTTTLIISVGTGSPSAKGGGGGGGGATTLTGDTTGAGTGTIATTTGTVLGGHVPALQDFSNVSLTGDCSNSGTSLTCTHTAPVVFVGAATNSGNTYAITSPAPGGFTLTDQYRVHFKAPATNTGASTLNVGATGATAIEINASNGVTALAGGEIVSGLEYDATYQATCTCFVLTNSPAGAVVAGTSQTVSALQWANWTFFNTTTAAQTITLPVSSGLSNNGGIVIAAIGNSVTLTPNAADAINGGAAGASVTVASGATAFVTKSSAGNIAAGPLTVGSSTGANPTATAGATAVNGSATTFMRSDGAPAVALATATTAGLVPTPPNNTTTFLRGDATFAAPPAGGGSNLPTYIVSNWYTPRVSGYVNVAAGTASPAATTAYCTPFWVDQSAHFDHVAINITTISGGGNAQVALYNSAAGGRPGTLIQASGNLSTGTGTQVSGAITSAALTAGTPYWTCIQADNTTVRYTAYSTAQSAGVIGTSMIGSATLSHILSTSANIADISTPTGITSFGVWPDFTSAVWTDDTGSARGAVVALEVASVP